MSKKYVLARNAHFLKLSSLTEKCIFCFVLSLLISLVATVKYRNDSINEVHIYFWYLRGGRLFERGRLFISWENAKSCFWTRALIEKWKEDEHAITETE